MGHTSWVQSVAFSHDGTLIALCSDDRTIRIWDVKSRTQVGQPLLGHSDGVSSVAFSPNGMFIASGSSDNTIRIWDVGSRSIVGRPLEGYNRGVRSVAFSLDGDLLASGSQDRTFRIWDVRLGIVVGEPLVGHSGWVQSVAFSLDSSHLVSGSDDTTVRIWETRGFLPANRGPGVSREMSPSPPTAVTPRSDLQAEFTMLLGRTPQLQDGWIVNPDGDLILWIPPSLRDGIGGLCTLVVLGRPNGAMATIDFGQMACGAQWAECCTGGLGQTTRGTTSSTFFR